MSLLREPQRLPQAPIPPAGGAPQLAVPPGRQPYHRLALPALLQPQAPQPPPAAATGAAGRRAPVVVLFRNSEDQLVNGEGERVDSMGRLLNTPPVAGAHHSERGAIVLLTFNEERQQLENPRGEWCDEHGRLKRPRGGRGARTPQPKRQREPDAAATGAPSPSPERWPDTPSPSAAQVWAGTPGFQAATGAAEPEPTWNNPWANYRPVTLTPSGLPQAPPAYAQWAAQWEQELLDRTSQERQAEFQANLVRQILRSRRAWTQDEWDLYHSQEPSSDWELEIWESIGWQDWRP